MPAATSINIRPVGDTAVTVEFHQTIDLATSRRVWALDRAIASAHIAGIIETVPTYRALLVHYDPIEIGFDPLSQRLTALASAPASFEPKARRWRVPVAYGGEHGQDLDVVARRHGLSTDEVIRLHLNGDYRVAMLGFTPGFAYLLGLDPALETPRRPEPRPLTPPGTISIGGMQAGIQCLAGPSGWHLLGRTPVRTFHPHRDPVFLLEPGDAVTFDRIKARDFASLDRAADRGQVVAELASP